MSYCFATEIETGKPLDTKLRLVDFRHHMVRYCNNKKALQTPIVSWITENAPDTMMVVKMVTTDGPLGIDDSVRFKNIHPDIDGLTRNEAITAIDNNSSLLLFVYQMATQMCVKQTKVIKPRWCAILSDISAVEYKLNFPNAKALTT